MFFGDDPFKVPDNKNKGIQPMTFIIFFLSIWLLLTLTFFV